MAVLHGWILLTAVITRMSLTNSLKCYSNFCGDESCLYQGQGVQQNCGEDSELITHFCWDGHLPYSSDGQIGLARCGETNKTIEKLPGCGTEYDHLVHSPQGGCICFEDLCNNHFKPATKFARFVKANGERGDDVETTPEPQSK